jgi:hypothetical protein
MSTYGHAVIERFRFNRARGWWMRFRRMADLVGLLRARCEPPPFRLKGKEAR